MGPGWSPQDKGGGASALTRMRLPHKWGVNGTLLSVALPAGNPH